MKAKLELFLVFFTDRSHSRVRSREMFKNTLSFAPSHQGGNNETHCLPDFRHTWGFISTYLLTALMRIITLIKYITTNPQTQNSTMQWSNFSLSSWCWAKSLEKYKGMLLDLTVLWWSSSRKILNMIFGDWGKRGHTGSQERKGCACISRAHSLNSSSWFLQTARSPSTKLAGSWQDRAEPQP